MYTKGENQGDITIVHEDCGISGVRPVSDIYYLPDSVAKKNKPNFIEFNLYRKIVSNKEGRALHVIRSDKRLKLDGTIRTFGYPNVTLGGGEGRLNYKAEDHEFFVSKLGLWLLDYLRRTDQQLSHLQLNGIMVPEGGYTLTAFEESEFIENGNWKNSANSTMAKNTHNENVGSSIERSDDRIGKTGEVFTPMDICHQMVSELPLEMLQNPRAHFLIILLVTVTFSSHSATSY